MRIDLRRMSRIGRTKFLEVVEDGRMPQPVRIEEEMPRLHEHAASRGAVHVALLSATSGRDFHCPNVRALDDALKESKRDDAQAQSCSTRRSAAGFRRSRDRCGRAQDLA